jgi:hypothetical protein
MVYAGVRCLFYQVAVGRMGYPAAEVARFLGATTLALLPAAHTESHPEIENIYKFTGIDVPLLSD